MLDGRNCLEDCLESDIVLTGCHLVSVDLWMKTGISEVIFDLDSET